ncbi:MAG: hypothetical protein ACTTKL_01015 [Treponema sp.]
MKNFGANNNSVIPPRMGESVPMRCKACGKSFRAKYGGIFAAFVKPACPNCGSGNMEKDGRVMN